MMRTMRMMMTMRYEGEDDDDDDDSDENGGDYQESLVDNNIQVHVYISMFQQ